MTPEERRKQLIDEVKRKRLIQQVKQKRAAQPSEPEDEISALNPRGLGRSAMQGTFLGWGDEIVGAGVATAAKAGNLLGLNEEERPWGEVYDDVRGAEDFGLEQYQEDNPIASIGTEIATGFITDRFIPGGGARTGNRVRKLAKALGRNMGEGAVAGAGVADENRGQGALIGGGVGGVLGGTMHGLGKIPALVSQRNVQAPLRGKPLHLATEPDAGGAAGVLGNLYRRGIGGSFGGRNVLREQERPFTDAAEEAVETAKNRLVKATEAKSRRLNTRLDELDIDAATMKAQTTDAFADKVEDVTRQAVIQSQKIKNTPKLLANTESANLRKQAADAALPERMDKDIRSRLINENPQDVSAGIKDWWKANGFDSVRKNAFNWNNGELISTLKDVVDADPGMKLKFDKIPGMTKGMVKKLLNPKKGEVPKSVSGEQLMAMRNFFAMASNNTSNKFDKNSLRTVANEFDDFIRKQLDPDDLKAFNDDLGKYGPSQTYFDAVDKAYKDNGQFTADQWLSVLPRDKRLQGRGLLQPEATGARSRIETAQQAADKMLAKGGELPEETRVLTKALKRRGRKVAKDQGFALKKAKRQAREKADVAPGLLKARENQEAAKLALKEINERSIPKNTTWPSQIVSTSVLGGPLTAAATIAGGPAGLAAAIPAGYATSKFMARKGVGDLLAGQKRWQRKLQIARKRYQDSPTERNLQALRYAMQSATIRQGSEE